MKKSWLDHSPIIVLPFLQLTHRTFFQTWMLLLCFFENSSSIGYFLMLSILLLLLVLKFLCCFWFWCSICWTCLVKMKEWNKGKLQMKTNKSSLKSWIYGTKLWQEEKFQLQENGPLEKEQNSSLPNKGAKMGQIGINWPTWKTN